MSDLMDMFYALSDSFAVALKSFNPLTVITLSLIVGLFQTKRTGLALKALAVTLPALAIGVVMPFFAGIDPSLPDIFSPEFQIQALLSFGLGFAIIGILGLVKSTLSLAALNVKNDVTRPL